MKPEAPCMPPRLPPATHTLVVNEEGYEPQKLLVVLDIPEKNFSENVAHNEQAQPRNA